MLGREIAGPVHIVALDSRHDVGAYNHRYLLVKSYAMMSLASHVPDAPASQPEFHTAAGAAASAIGRRARHPADISPCWTMRPCARPAQLIGMI